MTPSDPADRRRPHRSSSRSDDARERADLPAFPDASGSDPTVATGSASAGSGGARDGGGPDGGGRSGGSGTGSESSSGSGSGGDRPRRRVLLWTLPLVAALLLGALGGIGFAAAIHMPRVESVEDYTPTLITELRDRDGAVFATYARERRMMLTEAEVPPLVRDAILAAEDSNFYQHGGVDAVGVVRAFVTNLRTGERTEGASTLTMQVARRLFLSPEKTWRRKIEEALLSVELEKNLSKDQIFTLYVNLAPLGHGQYGFEAGARYFFNKPASELTAGEAATLVGILPRPSDYSPYRRPELMRDRRDHVLRRMAAEGYLGEAELEEALAQPLLVVQHGPRDQVAPYFAEEVRQHLEAQFGPTRLYEGGLQVATTLDRSIQKAADEALRRGLLRIDHRRGFRGPTLELEDEDLEAVRLPSWSDLEPEPGRWYQGIVLDTNSRRARVKIHDRIYVLDGDGIEWTRRGRPSDLLSRGDVAWFRLEAPADAEPDNAAEPRLFLEQEPEVEGAVLVIESATGAVRGMVGGWDFDRSKFNRAVQAERQVGSAFKVFVYGAALEMGYTPADTLFDGPVAFPGGDGELSYRPRNHSRTFEGILTLRRALERSQNVPAVKLQDLIGVDRVIDFARRSGLTSPLPPYPSLALGASEHTPLEVTAAFGSIANQGTWVEPFLVERVTAHDGRVLERHLPQTRQVTNPEVAYVLTSMLQGVTQRGTANRLRDLPLELAGKTGTPDDYSDAWFIGFTPRYTIVAWVGYDLKKSLGRGMDGSTAAAPIWRDVVEAGLEDGWLEEGETFQAPAGVVTETIDRATGLVVDGPGFQESFVAGTQPVQPWTPQWELVMGLPWYQQMAFYLPKEGERMPDDPFDVAAGDELAADGEAPDGPASGDIAPGAGNR